MLFRSKNSPATPTFQSPKYLCLMGKIWKAYFRVSLCLSPPDFAIQKLTATCRIVARSIIQGRRNKVTSGRPKLLLLTIQKQLLYVGSLSLSPPQFSQTL